MTYMLAYETLNTLIWVIFLLYGLCIACEFLKDDMKILYRTILLLINAALGLVAGWSLFTTNVLYTAGTTMQYEPLGFILATSGAFSFLLLCVTLLPYALRPYSHAGSGFQSQMSTPKKPRQPGY